MCILCHQLLSLSLFHSPDPCPHCSLFNPRSACLRVWVFWYVYTWLVCVCLCNKHFFVQQICDSQFLLLLLLNTKYLRAFIASISLSTFTFSLSLCLPVYLIFPLEFIFLRLS